MTFLEIRIKKIKNGVDINMDKLKENEFRTVVSRGRDGTPIGRAEDGRIILFVNAWEAVIGKVAIYSVVSQREKSISGRIETLEDLKVQEVAPVAVPMFEEKKKDVWNSVCIRLARSGAGYGFNLPGAMAIQLKPFHGKIFEVKYRVME